jgi:metallo-beta-lactamase family protein
VLDGFSAHAGHGELLDWLGHVVAGRPPDQPPRVVLTHGEDPERQALATAIRERFGITAELPGAGAVLQV